MTLNYAAVSFVVAVCLSAAVLDQPERSVALAAAGRSAPVRFQNGYFVAFDRPSSTTSLFGRDGSQRPDLVLTNVAGVADVTVRTVAVSPHRWLVAAASCHSADSQVMSALIWIDPSGKVTSVVRTSPNSVLALAFASDGTLWTAGQEYRTPGHHVARQFDGTGKMIRSLLPVESFPRRQWLAHAAELVEMAAPNDGGIGMFVPASSEWIDISKSGDATRTKLPVATDGKELVTGVALADNGDPLLSIQPVTGEGPARLMRYRRSERKTEILQECELQSCGWAHVAGADGKQLVMEGPRGQFGWFSLP